MNKTAMDAILSQYKKKLAVIIADGGVKIPVNVNNGYLAKDIKTLTIGGTDFIQLSNVDPRTKNSYKYLIPIDCIQGVIYTDDDLADIDFMRIL